ncbi:hypothetical protein AGLY_010658, partial [Aphis glycines]
QNCLPVLNVPHLLVSVLHSYIQFNYLATAGTYIIQIQKLTCDFSNTQLVWVVNEIEVEVRTAMFQLNIKLNGYLLSKRSNILKSVFPKISNSNLHNIMITFVQFVLESIAVLVARVIMNGRVISFVVFRNSVLSLYLHGAQCDQPAPTEMSRALAGTSSTPTHTDHECSLLLAAAAFPSKSTRLAIVPMTPGRLNH